MNSSDEPNKDSTDIPATKSDDQDPYRIEDLIGPIVPLPDLLDPADDVLDLLPHTLEEDQDIFTETQHELEVPEHWESTGESYQRAYEEDVTGEEHELLETEEQNPYEGVLESLPVEEDQTADYVGKKAKKKKRKRKQTLKIRSFGSDADVDESEDLPNLAEPSDVVQTHDELREQLIGEILENSLKSLFEDPEKKPRKLRRSSTLHTKILPQDLLEDLLNSQDRLAENEKATKKRKLKKSVSKAKASESFTPHLNGSDELIGWESLEENNYGSEESAVKKKRKRRASCGGTSASDSLVDNAVLDDGSANYYESGCLNIPPPSREDWYLPEFQPIVLLQRITPAHIAKYKKRPGRPRKSNIAKKHTRSYFVPNLKGRDPLKLTLKLSAAPAEESRSFEVVHTNTTLIGPGGAFNLNGTELNEVKQEVTDKEEDFLPSVEGSVDRSGEEGDGAAGTDVDREPQTLPSKEPEEPDGIPETPFDKIDDSVDNEEREDSEPEDEEEEEEEEEEQEQEQEEEEEEEDEGGINEEQENSIDIKDNIVEDADAVNERDSLEEVCRETINDLKRLEEAEDSGSDQDQDQAPPSPTPSEQLRPDFLAPLPSPTPSEMVEHNTSDVPATSPAYPSTSPAPPPPHKDADGKPDEPSFQWGNSEVNESHVSPSNDDHDPLLIPDQTPNAASSAMLDATNESLLRGFLSESSEKNVPPVTLANQDGLLALGSEYMSLERLGDGAFRCEACGERFNDQESFNDHRQRAGHFKCAQAECGNVLFKSSEDLAAHTRVTHPPQFPRPPLVMINQSLQSPPVQQLAQQVQRLPMPQPYLSQHAPMVQLHQLLPQPGAGFQGDGARRPPPLYRVPAPTGMPPPQFSNTQQIMSQMFSQPYRHPQTGQFMQQMQPNQQQMQQQQQPRPNFMQQMQQPRGPGPQQQRMPQPQQQQRQQQMGPQIRAKRMATGPPLGGSPNAKRRMDMLIPDRHDNADCHVIAMQKRTDSGPVINSVEGSKIHLTDSITMSAVRPGGGAVTATPIGSAKNKSDAKAVANVLASRGITVTPAGGGNNPAVSRNQRATPPRPAPVAPTPVTTLNLNSAISIIPTGNQNSGFAVPQNRAINRQHNQTNVVERPPRPPTVDLTGDLPMMGHPRQMHGNSRGGRMRGRPPGSGGGRNQCQICDKAFSTEESLAQHMQLHRSPGKLPYRCNLCPAQYPTQQGLLQHRQVYHKEPATSSGELALPVVDLKQPGTLSRLASMGIQHYLPLSQLSSQQGGYFGLPIVSIDGARNPAVCNLGALGASNILSLGPMKPLPR